ncbi:coiled-coil domain-containing protein 122 isoform X2 [Denticeps clupeoides]|uniref:coiled-coil domain-containing protein 122 isoform X2 n=1 Tax=Denticeps clupeoides TaxID=299321 RepID=UPI0010A50F2D|nr:coiled-coil domain-containing protein 122 isoform X2 [Denticeps clupeoides]
MAACGDGGADFSLSEALEEASQHGETRASELREKTQTLDALQGILSSAEKSCAAVNLELKTSERKVTGLQCEMEQLRSHLSSLEARLCSLSAENTKLTLDRQEEEERRCCAQARHDEYRRKMASHKKAVSAVESQADVYRELMEKREIVRWLREQRKELQEDLQNPERETARQSQNEIKDLKRQILLKEDLVKERQNDLQKEKDVHAELRKDIEIQNRRCEAIIKRLHCQVNKTQCSHRQLICDIKHMEGRRDELKAQLAISQFAPL